MIKTINFKIDGDWLTDHVRCLWAEEACDKAMSTLDAAFPDMSEEKRIAICTGKTKLSGCDEMCLEKDDAAMSSHGLPLLSPIQMLIKAQATIEAKKKEFNDFVREVNEAREREEDEEEVEKYDFRTRKLTAKGERINEEIERRLGIKTALMVADPRLAAAHEAIFNPPTEKPVQDKALDGKSGWIRPDGAFFACAYMGHVNLADRLGSTEGKMEQTWVKIQSNALLTHIGLNDFRLPDRGVTQAQFNTMDKWCTKHKRKLPTNIEMR